MPGRTRTSPLSAVHETARDLHAAGIITTRAMKIFDALCAAATVPRGKRFKPWPGGRKVARRVNRRNPT